MAQAWRQDEARPSLTEQVERLVRELPALVSDRVTLLSLEVRRAGQALSEMAVLLIAAALLGSTAWLTLWAAIGYACIRAGVPWGWVVVGIVGVNLAAAVLAARRALALVPKLALPATLRR
ncbi:MAG: phage holin family protein, partial [Burkholderiaceae bacterium]